MASAEPPEPGATDASPETPKAMAAIQAAIDQSFENWTLLTTAYASAVRSLQRGEAGARDEAIRLGEQAQRAGDPGSTTQSLGPASAQP